MQTFNAHFDGRVIVVDEPARLKPNAKVTVIAPDADDDVLADDCARLSEPVLKKSGIIRWMPIMTGFKRGSIILLPFPFSDQSSAKIRPAVVVSPDYSFG